MTPTPSQMLRVKRRYMIAWRVALLMSSLVVLKLIAGAQTPGPSSSTTPEKGTTGSGEKAPLTDAERAELLKLIKSPQERVEKLEAAQAGTTNAAPASVPVATTTPVEPPAPANIAILTLGLDAQGRWGFPRLAG